MRDRAQVRIIAVQITERAAQKRKQLRLVMIALGANLDQLDKVSRSLSAKIIFPDTGERIFEDDFGESVERRFPAHDDRNFRFKKKIELARERSFRAARALGHRLNAT